MRPAGIMWDDIQKNIKRFELGQSGHVPTKVRCRKEEKVPCQSSDPKGTTRVVQYLVYHLQKLICPRMQHKKGKEKKKKKNQKSLSKLLQSETPLFYMSFSNSASDM